MKVFVVQVLVLSSLITLSCQGRRPRAPKAKGPDPVCEKRTAEACLELARGFEEQGNARYLEAYEAACQLRSTEACDRVLAEVELTVLAAPTVPQLETWTHRLAQLCAAGHQRACVFGDLLAFYAVPLDATAMKKAYFRLQESCQIAGKAGRDVAGTCVPLVQALGLLSRKNSAFFKQNALTGYQTACHAGIGEACLQEPLLQREKRDLEWTLSYLLKACELGELAGCDALVAESRRAVLEGKPRYDRSVRYLKTACFTVDHRSSCLTWAEGQVRGWWESSDPAAGHAEHLRQCGLGSDVGCIEFARRLLETAPDQVGWARQILRQSCSEGHAVACVLLARAMRSPGAADPEVDRRSADILRASCYGPGGAQPNYYNEYDYDRSSYNSTYNQPACAELGHYLLEGIGFEVNEAVGFRLLSSGCSSLAASHCVRYGEVLRRKGQVNASGITPIYERICLAGHEDGCFALSEIHKTGYKELKPSEAQAKKYLSMGCRLAPAHAHCKGVK